MSSRVHKVSKKWESQRAEATAYKNIRRKRRNERRRKARKQAEFDAVVNNPRSVLSQIEVGGRVLQKVELMEASVVNDPLWPDDVKGVEEVVDLDSLTKAQLYEMAQGLGIPGRSKMTKEQLIVAIGAEQSE